MGLSGQELATRAIAQAEKFGAKMMIAHSVAKLDCARRPFKVLLDNGTDYRRAPCDRNRGAVQQAAHRQFGKV